MKNRWFLLSLLLIFGLILASCGDSGGETPQTDTEETVPADTTETEPEEEAAVEEVEEETAVEDIAAEADVTGIEQIRIAVVMPSTVTDLAWSQAVYDSLLRLQAEAGGPDVLEIAYTENMFNVTDAAAALRDYAADGFDIVLAHGTQYGTSMFEIAPDFPKPPLPGAPPPTPGPSWG
jgi:basic membrane lipoprotein Med (substrate-binding protein (PBP1-ABC) superfamily)